MDLTMASVCAQLQAKLDEADMTPLDFLNAMVVIEGDDAKLQECTKMALVHYFESHPGELATWMQDEKDVKTISEYAKEDGKEAKPNKIAKKRKREEDENENPVSRPKLMYIDLNEGENVTYHIKAGIISKWWGDYIPKGLKETTHWQSASDFDVLNTPENAKLLKELTYRWNRVVKGGGNERMYDIISYCRPEESGVELCISFRRVKYTL